MFLRLLSLAKKPNKPGSFTETFLSKVTLRFGAFDERDLDFSYYIVQQEEEMRPDLVSKRAYGNQNYTDLICKYNNIYNPFSLEKGTLIRIPNKPEKYYIDGEDRIIDKGTIKGVTKKVTNTQTDTNRAQYLAGLNGGNLPPNFNLPRDANIKFVDGNIIFGGDVTSVNKADCPTPISRSRVVKALIESKIFK